MSAPFHYMQLPREVIVGHHVLERTGETCLRLRFNERALLVTGEKVNAIAGQIVGKSLNDSKIKSDLVLVGSVTDDQVKAVEREIKTKKPQLVLGLGGGKDIDVAKLASARQEIPFFSLPTVASHDGIASPVVSMKGAERPYSIVAHAPLAIIADLTVIAGSPFRLLASGCGDVIAKHTAVRDWRLAHRIKNEYYGDYAADLALMSARLVMRNAHTVRGMSEVGVRTVVEALISCGVAMSIAGSSRPCSGAEHMISHAIDQIAPSPALHGEQVGVATIICAYLHGTNWQLIQSVLHKIGAPSNAKELGIEEKHFVEALTVAHKIRPERYTILGESGITKDAAEKVARITGVIG